MQNLTFLLLTVSIAIAPAETRRVETFADALKQAKEAQVPVAVYIHGSSWQRASERFGTSIWKNSELAKTLKNSVILSDIHIRQSLDKEAAKAQAAKYKPWKSKTVRSYPAIQIYAPDGHLLKNIQGREFRNLTDVAAVASAIDSIAKASAARSTHLAEMAQARKAKNRAAETAALAALAELPINAEPKLIDQLKAADPEDKSGLQTKLGFKNWWFVREINGLVKKGETTEALARVDKMLTSPTYTAEQRIYLHGARGNALVALGKLEDAWKAYNAAHDSAPEDPSASAMLAHGFRVAGIPSRRVFPESSVLAGKDVGQLLSEEATFTMSSAAHDIPENHASLFKGAHRDFAFHTNNQKGAHIVVDLGSDCSVKALRITNRASQANRAQSLTVWHSLDGKTWISLWKAEKVSSVWEILPSSPVKARYLKVGLAPEVANFFHLRACDVYGERL